MADWTTDTFELPHGDAASEVCLQVEAGGGEVELQLLQPDDVTWYTPTDEDYTISSSGAVVIPRMNRPRMRVVPLGGAQVKLFGAGA